MVQFPMTVNYQFTKFEVPS